MRRTIRSVIESAPGRRDEFIECNDGAEAVVEYRTFRPDVVLMDIHLKALNGFSATELLRQLDTNVKVVYVTSYDTEAFRNKAQALRALGFVSKDNLTDVFRFI